MTDHAPILISHSEVAAFRQCRRRWALRSPLRENWVPRWPNKNLVAGSVYHAAVAEFYTDRGDRKPHKRALALYDERVKQVAEEMQSNRVPEDRRVAVLDELALVRQCLECFFPWAQNHDYFHILATEVLVKVKLPYLYNGREVWYVGRVDALARHKRDKQYWLLEWKTCSNFPDFGALRLDSQCGWYVWSARQDPAFARNRPAGMIYTFFKKKAVPAPPEPLKRGGFSKAKSKLANSTYQLYLDTLLAHDCDVAEYQDALDYLKSLESDNGSNQFIQRVEIPKSSASLATAENELLAIVGEMLDPNVAIYKSDGWVQCRLCEFKAPCQQIEIGADPSYMLAQEFIHPEARYSLTLDEN